MSAMDLSVTRSGTHRTQHWNELTRYLVERWQRAHSRHELMMLSDHVLSDVGLEPNEIHHDVPRSFWH